MKEVIITKEPVLLDGYQAILKPSQYGYSLSAVLGQDEVDKLEAGREDELKWIKSKLKNPRRAVLKPEPWEEVSAGKYKAKFSWKEGNEPPVVDTEGTLITDENLPLYSGSKVKLAFFQKAYKLPDDTYGTSLKLQGVQVVVLGNAAGADIGDLDAEGVADLFGKTQGFKSGEPNIKTNDEETEETQPDF